MSSGDPNFEDAKAIFDMDRHRLEVDERNEQRRIQADRDVKIAQAKAKEARWSSIGIFLGFAGFAIVVGVIAFFVWNGVKGPSAEQEIEERKANTCMEAGGTWINGINSRDSDVPGMCIGRGSEVINP